MLAEARWAASSGHCSDDTVERIERLLTRLGLATCAPSLGKSQLLDAIKIDKKWACGTLRLPVLEGLGRVQLYRISVEEIPELLSAIPDH